MMLRTSRPAAISLLEALYPPPAKVGRAVSRRDRRDASLSFTAVPSLERARIVLTSGHRLAAARAIRRQLNGRRRSVRAVRTLLALAARTGSLELLPRSRIRVELEIGEPRFDRFLADELGAPEIHLTLPIGPPRANRKPIVQVCDSRGAALAYAKVGHNELTRSLVRREGRVLRTIADAEHANIEVPAVRAEFDWYASSVLVIDALAHPARSLTETQARTRLVEVTDEIAHLSGVPEWTRWSDHPLRSRLLRGFDDLGERGDRFSGLVDGLNGETSLAVAAWHGDFNAGNFRLVPGLCPVWDWERFETGVPFGFDLLHHYLHGWITIDGQRPMAAARRLIAESRDILGHVVDTAVSEQTARAYLLTLAERYLSDDQETAGAALGAVTTWLLPALEAGDEGFSR